ncbi:MAG: divergent polysaccharide deacetylase family protein [Sulfurimonas sp.]|uniref:divergent polysaccharide deacetylase family protein n=1 Tax=Sulfurimonas sp. TaxID=2022749 RepID=UPI002617A9F2|nr:divergent polysaccharide deacetylase family protein [Sulfurimonas sp.]MDD2651703.1 divergent polysaccharide deacetylase family protein [Sulfurimonas sp.]MDD3451745.1 divergent polysaccharide deacetylase family protein [Sulfurimonas sp.]
MQKRKKTTSRKNSNFLQYIAWGLSFIIILAVVFVAGYYVGHDGAKREAVEKERSKEEAKRSMMQKLEEESAKLERQKEQSVTQKLKDVLQKDTQQEQAVQEIPKKEASVLKEEAKEYENASHEVEEAQLPTAPERKVIKSFSKPKLAIIIDDVSVSSHVQAIKSLHLPITMSFLPPSKLRPSSSVLAAKEDFYMVHLPMEAQNFKAEEPLTLRVDDSHAKILQRIEELKELFPKVKYINNHTGSKFTADEAAMDRLILALKSQNITFIDSRTTGSSKAQKVSKKYDLEYIGRDVFLDHQMDKSYIVAQIKKAIQIAKKHGTAIAIGHPHSNTIAALNESKSLFKEVELVLVDKL